MASIAFTVALSAVSKVQVKQPAATFVRIDKTINPLMTDGLIRLFQLQSASNFLWTEALFLPGRKMRMQPDWQLAKFACSALANVASFVRQYSLVGHLCSVAVNLPPHCRGVYTQLFGKTTQRHATGKTCLDLVTLVQSQLPVMSSHLCLNPLV